MTSVIPLKLVNQYPPPAVLPRPKLPIFSNPVRSNYEDIVDLLNNDVDEVNREVSRLRFENKRLEDELDSARMHPMFDPSFDRVNVDHALWLRQQTELHRLNEYKTRYYVVVGILALVTLKVILSLLPLRLFFHF